MSEKRQDYISWDEYFMGVAKLAGLRSKDPNSQVGSCIVSPDNKILSIGYNGFPRGCSDDVFPWSREGDELDTKYFYVTHSELNAILNYRGGSLEGSKIYVSLFPCNECSKAIIQSGIREIIYDSDKYGDTPAVIASRKMLDAAGVHYRRYIRSGRELRLYARLQQAVADRDSEHRAALHEQLEKERIKKQLTNNINHELKTPVASIRVSVETMLAHRNMSDEKQTLFLQRCLTNTERLQRLLTDVSLLTRMDDGSTSIIKEQVNLTDIINDVVEDRQILAATKGITIENFVSRDIVMAGNSPLLEAVFNNLIDNAIVYSGGTRIKIGLTGLDSDKVTLTLSDNGCGVPSEHLPRLFERFYRIDKGRSRAAGGTGLGLSIVKNAVIMHGGEIIAENKCSGGLLFKITFSRNSK